MDIKTILCVDDEINVLRALKRLLRKEPIRLLTANSGAEALEIMEHNEVHLVMSDYRMPGMTGTELLSEVSTRFPDTVQVVLSGFADAASIVDAINQGHIFRFLAKPWNDEELKANLKSCLEQHELIVRNRHLTEELAQRNAELKSLSDRQQRLIEERTRSLQMAQEIVQCIPMPIVGVNCDGLIALANVEADRLLNFPVGTEITRVFPIGLAEAVQRTLDDPNNGREVSKAEFDFEPYIAMVVPLRQGLENRGSLVLLESCPCVV
jgi:CheY-like chemotaxis protein